MTDHDERPAGPDLTVGVAADLIDEGGFLAGRVGDEGVLLARLRGRCYAVGSKCPHYGGPLAEGILVGDTIRCPWHHAAFDIRTAELERPPALDDLACWDVEEREGKVRVTGRAAPRKAKSRGRASVAHVSCPSGPVVTRKLAALDARRRG